MPRTKEQIQRQINGLKKTKETTPEYSMFGDNNWEQIDAQLDILEGKQELGDFDEGDWDEGDDTHKIWRAAEEADDWLNEENDDDLFDE